MEMELTKGRTALVVIDMQRAFLEDEGSLAKAGIDITGLKAALEPCKRLLASARQAGVPVIHTRYVYRADYADGGILVNYIMPQLREVDSLAAGTPDIEIVDELAPVGWRGGHRQEPAERLLRDQYRAAAEWPRCRQSRRLRRDHQHLRRDNGARCEPARLQGLRAEGCDRRARTAPLRRRARRHGLGVLPRSSIPTT